MSALANHAFVKMNGLGNEIVVVDMRAKPVAISADDARAAADPRVGPRPLDLGAPDRVLEVEPIDLGIVRSEHVVALLAVGLGGIGVLCVAALVWHRRVVPPVGAAMDARSEVSREPQ